MQCRLRPVTFLVTLSPQTEDAIMPGKILKQAVLSVNTFFMNSQARVDEMRQNLRVWTDVLEFKEKILVIDSDW
jgi:hypothetical protein